MDSLSQLTTTEIVHRAKTHAENGEYGKSSSFFMLLFHKDNSACTVYKDDFLSVFKQWLERLFDLEEYQQVSTFIRTVLETCQPLKALVVYEAASMFYARDFTFQAARLLHSCRLRDNLALEEFLERLHNVMVSRWHFRMLNDRKRNLAYSLALHRAAKRGHTTVLDIGSGTGILSLQAKKSGIEHLYSCDSSEVMCHIQDGVMESNHVQDIEVLNKMSTDLVIGEDIPQRVSLVVTEIFDCGLLGEGVVPTLKHAWKHLLVHNPNSEVIPHSAIIYGVCIECENIRKHSRFKYDDIIFEGRRDWCDREATSPYTSENMTSVRGGYTALSQEFVIKKINFTSLKDLEEVGGSWSLDVEVTFPGTLDGVMVYFDLHLDDTINLRTHPDQDTCWDEAIYTFSFNPILQKGDSVNLSFTCNEEYLSMELTSPKDRHWCVPSTRTFPTNRRLVARHNDTQYLEEYTQCIFTHIEQKPSLNICFTSPRLSILPYLTARKGDHCIYLLDPSEELLRLMHFIKKEDRIKCIRRPFVQSLSKMDEKFDLVISEPIEGSGLLQDRILEDLVLIRSLCSTQDTVFIPDQLTVSGICIFSEQVLKENRVLDDSNTLGFDIKSHINHYKVCSHPDVDTLVLPHKTLSNVVECCKISLPPQQKFSDPLTFNKSDLSFTINDDGSLTSIVTWFDVRLDEQTNLSTAPSFKVYFLPSRLYFL